MKTGEIYKMQYGKLDDGDIRLYMVINDYGVPRPLMLTGSLPGHVNMASHICQKALWTENGFYGGDVKVFDSLEDYISSLKGCGA